MTLADEIERLSAAASRSVPFASEQLATALRNAVAAILTALRAQDEVAALKARVAAMDALIAETGGHGGFDPVPCADMVEAAARGIAKSYGFDFDEICGVDADPDESYCDSSTCISAGYEDHDAATARGFYRHTASARPFIEAEYQARVVAWLREESRQKVNAAKAGVYTSANKDRATALAVAAGAIERGEV